MPNVKKCLINQAVIEKGKDPILMYADDTPANCNSKSKSGGKAS